MPPTPWATKDCTTSICSLRSSSRRGPFHTTSMSSSRAAFTAPACTLFQNSCVVPLGTTAMTRRGGASTVALLFLHPVSGTEKARKPAIPSRPARTASLMHGHPVGQLVVVHAKEDGVLRLVKPSHVAPGGLDDPARPAHGGHGLDQAGAIAAGHRAE